MKSNEYARQSYTVFKNDTQDYGRFLPGPSAWMRSQTWSGFRQRGERIWAD
jgi:hypothetical protein